MQIPKDLYRDIVKIAVLVVTLIGGLTLWKYSYDAFEQAIAFSPGGSTLEMIGAIYFIVGIFFLYVAIRLVLILIISDIRSEQS